MAATRRQKTYPELRPRARPVGKQLDGEAGLVAAFLRQVLDDTQSPNAEHRQEALGFLRDQTAVTFWCSLIGVNPQTFLAHAQRATGQG
jgi:hypothetical protein